MTPLTQTDLDKAGCDMPNCTHDHSQVYLVPGCHPNSAVAVLYNKTTGNLQIECRKCRQPVVMIAVATGVVTS